MFDAHSLFHAATIPASFFYFHFLLDDARYEHTRDVKTGTGAGLKAKAAEMQRWV